MREKNNGRSFKGNLLVLYIDRMLLTSEVSPMESPQMGKPLAEDSLLQIDTAPTCHICFEGQEATQRLGRLFDAHGFTAGPAPFPRNMSLRLA